MALFPENMYSGSVGCKRPAFTGATWRSCAIRYLFDSCLRLFRAGWDLILFINFGAAHTTMTWQVHRCAMRKGLSAACESFAFCKHCCAAG